LRLMAARIQQSDFQVSTGVLEWVASWELRMEVPDAFQSGTPATYHAQAVEEFGKYVRLVGISLSEKDSNVLWETPKAYRAFAEQKYCEPQTLIPSEQQNQVLAGVGIRP
jgi:hypothetical protein